MVFVAGAPGFEAELGVQPPQGHRADAFCRVGLALGVDPLVKGIAHREDDL